MHWMCYIVNIGSNKNTTLFERVKMSASFVTYKVGSLTFPYELHELQQQHQQQWQCDSNSGYRGE